AAVGQAQDAGRILFIRRGGVGDGFRADLVAGCVVLLEVDAAAAIVATTTVKTVARPRNDEAAALQAREDREFVVAAGRGIDEGLGSDRIADAVETLHVNVEILHGVVAGASGAGIALPHHDIAPARQAGDIVGVVGRVLAAQGVGVDNRFGAGGEGRHG